MNISCGTSCHVNILFTWATIGMKKNTRKKHCVEIVHFIGEPFWPLFSAKQSTDMANARQTKWWSLSTYGCPKLSDAGVDIKGWCWSLFLFVLEFSLGSGMYSRFHVPAKTYTLISSHVILSGFQGDQIIDNEGESRSVPSISIYKRIVRKWRHSQILHLLMVNLLNLCHSVSGNAVYIWYIYIQHICMLACMRSIHPSTHPIHT